LAVLDANWLGSGTSPSRRLYPHQWSWDAACIAMGQASWNQERAETEIRSLFAGQWRSGLLPHIVFTEQARYFPGPEFWQTERNADAPKAPQTSGIVQPPIHATAILEVYRSGPDRSSAHALLQDLQPKLAAWHDYLYRERTRAGSPLVEIWHPWESGMDNSPLWDEALERITLAPEQIPEYQRIDVDVADASERPTDEEYDRYTYLVGLYRELDYDPAAIREATPFALRPVLFNTLLVQGDLDLAEISEIVGRPTNTSSERLRLRVRSTRHSGTTTARCTPTSTCERDDSSRRVAPRGSPRCWPACPTPRAPHGWWSGSRTLAWRSARTSPSRAWPRPSPASSRLDTGAGRSGRSSTGCCSAASTAMATPLTRARSAGRCSIWPTAAASGSTTAP
jgi:hypothetical protein